MRSRVKGQFEKVEKPWRTCLPQKSVKSRSRTRRTRTLALESVHLKNLWNPGREFHHFCEFPPTSQQAAAREYQWESQKNLSQQSSSQSREVTLLRIENSTISVNFPQQASKQQLESISVRISEKSLSQQSSSQSGEVTLLLGYLPRDK